MSKAGSIVEVGSKRLAQLIRERMRILGIDQYEVADRARISYNYVARMTAARRIPTPEILERLAEALEVDRDEVFAASGKLPTDIERHMQGATAEQIQSIRLLMIPASMG